MRIQKFNSTDAFVAIDLADAGTSSGPMRWARKVLQGGAKDLARSQTYTYAVLGMLRGGASAGLSAESPNRAAALAAFITEAQPLVASGSYLPDAAKGVAHAELAALRSADERDTARLGQFAANTEALSAAVTAHCTLGGLEGRTVAIEGFAAAGPALAAAVIERGGRVTTVATSIGTIHNAAGYAVTDLAEAWATSGAEFVKDLGSPEHPMAVFGSSANIIFVGSKMGIVDHGVAAQLTDCDAVVASGRLPFTARALAVLRRAGVAAPADFVSLAGSSLAVWDAADRTDTEIFACISDTVGDLCDEVSGHDDGPFLAACYQAESFLRTWQDELPFGRPLAP